MSNLLTVFEMFLSFFFIFSVFRCWSFLVFFFFSSLHLSCLVRPWSVAFCFRFSLGFSFFSKVQNRYRPFLWSSRSNSGSITRHVGVNWPSAPNFNIILYSHIQLHVYIYKYMRKQSTSNERTSMNERIHFFIKIYLSHFILERVRFLVCETWVESRTDCYFDQSSTSTIAALLSNLGWGCSTEEHWGHKALCLSLVLTSASCLRLTRVAQSPGYIIF